jgi:DNA repair exonuclease SbcCD ATPase subunit
MKQITLDKLILKNFKGVKSFALDASCRNVKVFGDNATGKTTLFDSFIYLLFDKDSQNKKDFQIKTVSPSGKVIHGLEHEVEGVFSLDGRKLSLKKVFTEKWTKQRGSAEKQFTGHETKYFIDDVPCKKKEYTDKVAEIVDEDIFKLLTNPSYFNEQLHWEKRRSILLEICGDVSTEEVIASNQNLSRLPGILNGRSIEDHRKVINSRRSLINKELDKIPVRIDEINRNLPDTNGLDEKTLNTEIGFIQSQMNEKNEQISRINSGGEVAEKQKKLRELEGDLIQIKNQHQMKSDELLSAKKTEYYQKKNELDSLKNDFTSKTREIDSLKQGIARLTNIADRLRTEWHEKNNKTFEFTGEESCPSCGQSLPAEKVEAAKEKALADFNLKKSNQLEEIASQGKREKSVIDEYNHQITKLTEESNLINENSKHKQSEFENLLADIEQTKTGISNVETEPEYIDKQKEIAGIKQDIHTLQTSVETSISSIRSEIAKLQSDLQSLNSQLGTIDQVEKAKTRIAELEVEERELSAEYEKLEGELFLTEEFIRNKVQLLEQKINNRFKHAHFKLFSEQINGGLTETCETLFQGVSYSSGLNNAAKINVGLDIINTLSDHYGFLAPIWIDNSEAVTKLIDTKSQIITLVVSEPDKQLRVEQIDDSLITVDCEVIV